LSDVDLNPGQKINITQIGYVKNIILSINASLINTITFFALQDKKDDGDQDGSRSGKGLNSKFFRQLNNLLKDKGDDGKPILKDQLVDASGKVVKGLGNTMDFAKSVVNTQTKKVRMHFSKDGKKRTIFSIKIPMSDDHIAKRRD